MDVEWIHKTQNQLCISLFSIEFGSIIFKCVCWCRQFHYSTLFEVCLASWAFQWMNKTKSRPSSDKQFAHFVTWLHKQSMKTVFYRLWAFGKFFSHWKPSHFPFPWRLKRKLSGKVPMPLPTKETIYFHFINFTVKRNHRKVFNSLNKQTPAAQLIWMIFEVFLFTFLFLSLSLSLPLFVCHPHKT